MRAAIVATLVVGFAGQASADEPLSRAEANQRRPAYENYLNLVAEGCDARPDLAPDRARAALAKVFSATVEATSVLARRELLAGGKSAFTEDARDELKVFARETLAGVTVPLTWQDGQRACALAVLDRGTAAAWFRARFDEQDDAVTTRVEAARNASQPRHRLASLRAALRHAAARQRHLDRLLVATPDAAPPTARSSAAELEELLRVALDDVVVCVRAGSATPTDLVDHVVARLTERGLSVGATRPTGSCAVVATVDFTHEPGIVREGRTKVAWRVSLTLTDGDDGAAFASVSGADSDLGRDQAQALERARAAARRLLDERFDALLAELARPLEENQ